ncbi:MAG: hypothetical protein AB8B67_01635 [Rickettsiaceae bacterium]
MKEWFKKIFNKIKGWFSSKKVEQSKIPPIQPKAPPTKTMGNSKDLSKEKKTDKRRNNTMAEQMLNDHTKQTKHTAKKVQSDILAQEKKLAERLANRDLSKEKKIDKRRNNTMAEQMLNDHTKQTKHTAKKVQSDILAQEKKLANKNAERELQRKKNEKIRDNQR